MTGKAYNAGTIFLQVVPVFKDTMDAIRREANQANKALGDELEKGGRDAGKRTTKAIEEEVGKVDLGAFDKSVRESARRASKAIGTELRGSIRGVKKDLDAIGDIDLTPTLDGQKTIAQMRVLARELRTIATSRKIEPEVRLNASKAYAEMVPLMKAFSAIDGRELNVNVDLDTGAAAAKLGILSVAMNAYQMVSRKATGSTDDTANSFRSFNFVILGAVTLLPALIPMIGALGGALLAIIPIFGAVAAGFGTMLVGFSGIGDAVTALGDVQDNAAKDAENAAQKMRSASRTVADAERALARARQSAAQANASAARQVADAQRSSSQAVRDALESQADAERNLADAQRDARQAQIDLMEARREAQEEIEQAADNRRANALAERQAQIDLFNAQAEYNATISDGGSTNLEREQASINLGEARLRLKEIRDRQEELADEKRRHDRDGVNGTETVQSAQDALTAALERQADAQRAVGDAAEDVRRARVEGARQVADAIRNQQQTEQSGAQAIADAQRNLTEAQVDYQSALKETGDIGSESMQKLEEAMGKLGPAGRKFARFIDSLRDDFYRFRADIQEAMLPGVQAGLETVIDTYGPQFQDFATRMAGVMGRLFEAAGRGLGNRPWREFFRTYSKLAPELLEKFGRTTGNWMGVYARLFTIVAPYAERLADALLVLSENALDWMESAEGTETWERFLGYAFRVLPDVVDFFKALWDMVINLAEAIAPWGELVMNALTGVMDFIGSLDPKVLGFIIGAIISLTVAFMTVVGVVALIAAGGLIFIGVWTVVLFAVLAVAGALVAAYIYFEDFRKVVDTVARAVGKAFKWLWEEVLEPTFKAIGDAVVWFYRNIFKPYWTAVGELAVVVFEGIRWAWNKILRPVLNAIWDALKWLWKNVVKPYLGFILDFWTTVFKGMVWAWKNVLWPVIDLIMTVVWELLKFAFRPVLQAIGDLWNALLEGMKWAWRNVLKPIFDFIIDTALPKLKRAFDWVVEKIESAWNKLKDIAKIPVKFVVETVLNNGLIAGFNKIAGFVGSDKMEKIDLPKGFARGGIPSARDVGIYPGYTPGRDVGFIGISGGEAIMRPEFTRVVGSNYVDYWNKVARTEGVAGIKRRMAEQQYGRYAGGFAKGGIPAVGTWTQHSGYPWARWAGDINVPGSGDYGNPVRAYKKGTVAAVVYLGDRSYGRYIKLNHPDGMQTLYAHLSSALVSPGQAVDRGDMIGRVGNVGNSSGPHLHFEIQGGNSPIQVGSGDDMGGGRSWLPDWLQKIVGAPIKWAKDKILEPTKGFAEKFGTLGQFAKDAMLGLAGGVGRKIREIVEAFVPDVVHKGPGADDEVAEDSHVKAAVRQVASMYGWGSGGQWAALDELIRRESGWDMYAANPSSSARGLFQKMTSIHGPVENTAQGQAVWGLNYIFERYGTPFGALNFHNTHGYYKDGGVVPAEGGSTGLADNGTMMYDNGGYLPPGLTTVVNLTGKPEPVFTAEQFDRMRSGGTGAGIHYEPHFTQSDLTADDVSGDLLFTLKRLEHGGKYARSGS